MPKIHKAYIALMVMIILLLCLWGLFGMAAIVLTAGAFVAWRVRQQRHKRRQACLKQKRVNAPQLSEHQIYLMTKNTPAAQLEVLNDVLLVSLSLLHDCLSDIVIPDGTLFDEKFKKLIGLLKRINARPELAMPTVSTVSRVTAIVIFAFYRLLYAGVLIDAISQGVVAADTDKYVLLKRIPPKMMRYLGSQSWRAYELKTLIYGDLKDLTLNADIRESLEALCEEKPILPSILNVQQPEQAAAPGIIPAIKNISEPSISTSCDIEVEDNVKGAASGADIEVAVVEGSFVNASNESNKALIEQFFTNFDKAIPETAEPLVPGEILDLNDETASSPVINSPKRARQQSKFSHAQTLQAVSEIDKQHKTQTDHSPTPETETLVLDSVNTFERKFVSWLQRQVKRHEINKSERLFMDIQRFGKNILFLNDVALSDFAKKDRIAIDQLRSALGQLPMCVNKQFVLERLGLPNMFLYAMTIDFTVEVTNSLPGTIKEVSL